ncbi:MAG: TolC family protein, partial [Gemmatimonadetes bacterium]|nr:TolC family protein [Gemmatimonadota bacterium]
AQQLLELRQNTAAAAAAAAGAAAALRAAGNVSALLLTSEEATAAQAAADLTEAVRDVAVARAGLSRLLGAGVGDTLWEVPVLLRDPDSTAWRIATLDSLALGRRLDVAAARDAARAAAAAVGLSERFALLADGTIGAFAEREPDGLFSGPTVSVPLPLFDQGGAVIARARAVLRERVARHDALVGDVHADVRIRLAQLRSARERAQQLRHVVLPLRRRVIAEAQRHVNVNDITVFALLQAKQGELDAARSYLDALRDYWNARSDLERAVGGTLPGSATP